MASESIFVSNFLGEHAPTRPLDTTCVVCRLWPHHLELPCYSPDFVVNEYCVINYLCPPKIASGLILILLLNLALLLCNALCERSLYEVNCHKCPHPSLFQIICIRRKEEVWRNTCTLSEKPDHGDHQTLITAACTKIHKLKN